MAVALIFLRKFNCFQNKTIIVCCLTYNFVMDMIPCKRPLPPRIGSRANNKPTAQS